MNDSNPTVVITGATKGLGRELSLAFASDGYTVIGLYHSDSEAANVTESEFASRGFNGVFVRQDITADGAWPNFDEVLSSIAATSVTLIANASAQFTPKPFHLVSGHELADLLSVNLVGTHNVFKRLLPLMIKIRNGTMLSVLSSALATRPKGFAAYLAAKSALLAMTQLAALEYRDRGIRFLCASPGFMETPLTEGWNALLKESITRRSDPAQVAAEILALTKDSSLPGRGEDYLVGRMPEHSKA